MSAERSAARRAIAIILCVVLTMPVISLLNSEDAEAWKPEQHCAMSKIVLDDIWNDGSVNIEGVEYPINSLVYGAVKTYPQYYRMGALGIDAYPDFYYSQMFIHPSKDLPDGPETYSYEWPIHLLNRAIQEYYNGDYYTSIKAIAFAYGVMAHYAGDMFGHTYINECAGGPWDLTHDGGRNAIRHLIVETYIKKLKTGTSFNGIDDPFGEPLAVIDNAYNYGNDWYTYVGDDDFHRWLFDSFYRDPLVNQLMTKGKWIDFWNLVLGLDESVDIWLAEWKKPWDKREWWAVPSPTSEIVKKYLEDWRTLIHEGIDHWMHDCSVVVYDLFIDPNPRDALDTLKTWCKRVPGMLMGPITDALIKAVGAINDFMYSLMVVATGGLYYLWDQLKSWAMDQLTDWIFSQVFGISLDDFEDILLNPETWFTKETPLDVWRGAPLSGPGTKAKVDADMAHSMATGVFVADDFAPVYNTILMTKLTLLDGQGLNNVLREYGVKALYPDLSPTTPDELSIPDMNILYAQMKSLDADHQWMKFAPPSSSPSALPSYGTGMLIWEDSKLREMFFKKIFHMGTEVEFQKPKVATLWGVDTPLLLNITNTGDRSEAFNVQVVKVEGFDGFSQKPSGTIEIGPGETKQYTVHFMLQEISGRDYGGGRLTVKATPVSAGDDSYHIYGNEASCTVVAFPFANPTFWLDIDEPVEYLFDREIESPSTQPYVVNLNVKPGMRWDNGNTTWVVCPLKLDTYAPYAYISSRTRMRLYGFSEEGGSFAEMKIRYESAPHLSLVWLPNTTGPKPVIVPCPDYKETVWINLTVKEVNFVDVGYEHVVPWFIRRAYVLQLCKYAAGIPIIPDPHIYYFSFDQVMAANNTDRPIEWPDDVYVLEYWGKTELLNEYSNSYRVYLDNTPPQTTLRLDQVDNLTARPIRISTDSKLSFTAWDRGSGVAATNYRIIRNMTVDENASRTTGTRVMVNDNSVVVPWTSYNEPFNMSRLAMTGHSGDVYIISWYSYDKVSNFENIGSMKVTLVYDETPPSTDLMIGTPNLPAVDRMARAFITHETPIYLDAADEAEPLNPGLTGVLETRYRITNSQYDGQWCMYNGSFTLPEDVPDGFTYIEYRSTDKCLNTEVTQRAEVILDTDPPNTDVVLTGPSKAAPGGYYVEAGTTISLVGIDPGSGVNHTDYSISGASGSTGALTYSGPFNLSGRPGGEYILDYCSMDNMSNLEQNKSTKLVLVSSVYYAGAHNISGHVSSVRTGLALSGASVMILPGAYSAITDAQGDYSVLVPDGVYTVTASASEHVTHSESVTVSGQDVNRDFQLGPSRHRMSGHVYDQSTGSPVMRAMVTLSPGGAWAITNSTGYYSLIGLLIDTYTVTVSATGYRVATAEVVVPDADVTKDYALAAATWSVSGKVTASGTTTGMPAVLVSLAPGEHSAATDDSGHYSLGGIPDGTYTLTASVSGYQTVSKSISVSGRDVVQDLAMEPLPEPKYTISGHVYDLGTGEPVQGAVLKSGALMAETDADGHYSLTVPDGTYKISVSAEGYDGRNITVVVSGKGATADIELGATSHAEVETSGVAWPILGLIIAIVAAAAAAVSLYAGSRGSKGVPPEEPPPPPD